MNDEIGPLTGYRVLDVSTILAGPLCCQILGDFGAEVIKVEHPRGDGLRGHGPAKDGHPLWWAEVGRNKRALALLLSVPEGAQVLLDLVSISDVLVENFRPGTMEAWGLGPDVLRARNPRLIVLRVTGFGQSGPYARRPGFGTIAEAMSGFAHLTGEADGPPTLPAFGLADSICGVAGSAAVAMALLHRETTGRGQVIDLSILEPMMMAVGPHATVFQQLGEIEHRHGNRSIYNAPRNAYRTKDGKWVAISTSALRVAERVVELVGHPEVASEDWFATGSGRASHADELDGFVADWVGARTLDEVAAEFDTAGAVVGPVYDARQLVEDEHVRATGMLTEVDDPDLGPLLMHNVLWRMSDSPGAIRFTGRGVGADTQAVLEEDLGYPRSRVDKLRESGVIA